MASAPADAYIRQRWSISSLPSPTMNASDRATTARPFAGSQNSAGALSALGYRAERGT